MRARLIYNPVSGQEIIKKHIADLLDRLESFGYETSAFATTPEENSALKEAERCAKSGKYDLVLAGGGDGTINEVASGLMAVHKSKRPKMAIIPTGTTNDFARALKIPRGKPMEAIEYVGKKQTLNIDMGRFNGEKYFINIAAGGALTELTFSVSSQVKTAFGYLAYLSKGAELLPRVKKTPLRVTYDGTVLEEEVSMYFCALTNSVGGFENIAPDSQLNDGLFTLILVKTDNIFELIALLAIVANGSGNHVNDINVDYIKAKDIKIECMTDNHWLVNLDGEFGGEGPVHFENIKGAIETFVNLEDVPDEKYIDEEEIEQEIFKQKFTEEVEKLRKEVPLSGEASSAAPADSSVSSSSQLSEQSFAKANHYHTEEEMAAADHLENATSPNNQAENN